VLRGATAHANIISGETERHGMFSFLKKNSAETPAKTRVQNAGDPVYASDKPSTLTFKAGDAKTTVEGRVASISRTWCRFVPNESLGDARPEVATVIVNGMPLAAKVQQIAVDGITLTFREQLSNRELSTFIHD
jgi:hypothetical protein